MSEIVRGVITNLDDFVELDKPSGLAFDTKVLVLPIEDGKVGPFEKWMVDFLEATANEEDDGDMPISAASCREIATAISRLFEEVESED